MPIHLIEENEINDESAEKLAFVKILKHINEVVGKIPLFLFCAYGFS